MLDSERVDGVSKEPGDEGRAVVCHDAAGADALAAIPASATPISAVVYMYSEPSNHATNVWALSRTKQANR